MGYAESEARKQTLIRAKSGDIWTEVKTNLQKEIADFIRHDVGGRDAIRLSIDPLPEDSDDVWLRAETGRERSINNKKDTANVHFLGEKIMVNITRQPSGGWQIIYRIEAKEDGVVLVNPARPETELSPEDCAADIVRTFVDFRRTRR